MFRKGQQINQFIPADRSLKAGTILLFGGLRFANPPYKIGGPYLKKKSHIL